MGKAVSIVVREGEGDQQLSRDDAETRPEGAVMRRERDDQLPEAEVRLGIDSDRHYMERDERAGQHTGKSVDVFQCEAGPSFEVLLAGQEQAQGDRRRHEQVGDQAGRASRVPVDRE